MRLVAQTYRKRGLATIPLRPGSKAPIHDGWPELVTDDSTPFPGNIGVKCGSPSGGMVDLDLDCDEARLLAPAVMPETGACFGRSSAPCAHWLYRCDPSPEATKKWTGDNGVILEVRSDGGQTMFPPSVHPDTGETVEWHEDGDLAPISAAALLRDAGTLAACSLLMQHWPEPEKRSRYVAWGAMIGSLLRCGVAIETVERVVQVFADRFPPGRSAKRSRLRAPAEFRKRLDSGKGRVPGFPALKEVFGEAVAKLCREWLPRLTKDLDGRAWLINLGAPYDTAELMLRAKFATEDGRRILHRHRDGFYRWNGAAYPEADDAEIRHLAYGFLNQCRTRIVDKGTKEWVEVPVKPNTHLVNELLDALRSAAFLSGEFAAPAWLEEAADLEPRDIIACANGLLHLPTLVLMPHTPAFFTHNALDYPFVAGAPAPAAWLAFLGQLWPDDGPSIKTLQEIFGYMLVADTSQQKMFMLVGARRSGKGTIGRVLARMVGGPPNVAAPPLAALGTNFGLAPLIGKRVGIISDARLGGRSDIAAITERLLSISGEDNLTIDRKHREAWTGSLGVRFLVLTNELPRFNDASGALASRFIVLLTRQSFLGREDPGLTDKLLLELPGILNWSISGWARLQKRGHFLQPATGTQAVAQMEALSSPIKAFADDCLILDPKLEASAADLYWAWQQWCEQSGRERAGTIQLFFRNLHAAFPQLKSEFRRQPTATKPENRVRWYVGIGLSEPVPKVDFGLH
jgi:P4 family phage/plasmid primase-like protien